ncbi:MAG: NADP oxidoreductase [Planctomycetota bacterium]
MTGASTSKPTLATMWLDGCSGCHMSLLDMDERLIEIASRLEVVASPYVDTKELPTTIDVAIVEGAVSSEEDWHKVRDLRRRTRFLIALGDCAVTGNVPAMRNGFAIEDLMRRAYVETADHAMWPAQERAASEPDSRGAAPSEPDSRDPVPSGPNPSGQGAVSWYPRTQVPPLRPRSCPVHEVVEVDLHVPGCPPPADAIYFVLTELLEGRRPDVSRVTRFGR